MRVAPFLQANVESTMGLSLALLLAMASPLTGAETARGQTAARLVFESRRGGNPQPRLLHLDPMAI
jgi:hypothetical protein